MRINTDWKKNFVEGFCEVYLPLVRDFGTIDAELRIWENNVFKLTNDMSDVELEEEYGSVAKLLKKMDHKIFPMLFQCLRIMATVPVTSCECERSISSLRRLKTYMRSTMQQERFSSLALLSIHRDFNHDIESIITKFAMKRPRKMALVNILASDENQI